METRAHTKRNMSSQAIMIHALSMKATPLCMADSTHSCTLQMEALMAAPGGDVGGSALLVDTAPACARLPLLPISMPHVDTGLSFSLRSRPLHAAAAGVADGQPAAAIASALQARLAASLLGLGDGGTLATSGRSDLAGAYSFGALVLKKPLEGQAAAAAAGSDDGGVAGAAMATLESLGVKFSGSAQTTFGGGVSAMQEQLGSVLLQPGGVFSSRLFSSAFGK
jgi:hypothetical protein